MQALRHFHDQGKQVPQLEYIKSARKAQTQDEAVYGVFTSMPERLFDKYDIKDRFPEMDELSIGRAICNLFKRSMLIAEGRHVGRKGKTVTKYRLAPAVGNQFTLF